MGEIKIVAPIFNPSDYLRIQILTTFGDLTNSLFVKYVKHIQIFEASTSLVYVDMPKQSIKVHGGLFDQNLTYVFKFTQNQDFYYEIKATYLSSNIIECDLSTIIPLLYEYMYI